MKFSGKMYLKIILKVRKNRSLTLSLEDTFSKKTQEGRRGEGKLNPPPLAVLGLRLHLHINDQTTHQRKNLKLPFFTVILETFPKFGG